MPRPCARGLPDQELGCQRRREGSRLGRLRRPCRRVVDGGHGAPVRGGAVRAVEENPHGPERRLVAQAFRREAALVEEGAERIDQRPVPRFEAVEHGMGALGLPRCGQPALEPLAQLLATPPDLRHRQHCGPGPAGEDHGLGREQGAETTRPLVENVVQRKAEPCRLPPGPGVDPCNLRAGLVRRPLQHQVERVAGLGEAAVEAPASQLDEAIQLGRAHHGPRPVQAEERHQGAVRQASSPSPAAAWGSMKLSSALRRRVQLAASASSRARCRGTPWYTVPPP